MSRWYMKRGDTKVGPGSEDQLRSAFKKGALQADALVRREDRQEWVPLKDAGILAPEDISPFLADSGKSSATIGGDLSRPDYQPSGKPLVHKDMFKEKPQFGSRSKPNYASFSDRLIAVLIDGAVLWFAYMIVSTFTSTIFYFSRSPFAGIMFSYLVQVVISGAYFVILQHEWGYTLGRKIMKIHVEMENRGKPDLQAFVVRYLGSLVSGFIFSIGYLLALSDPKTRTLHDRMAGTIVVKD